MTPVLAVECLGIFCFVLFVNEAQLLSAPSEGLQVQSGLWVLALPEPVLCLRHPFGISEQWAPLSLPASPRRPQGRPLAGRAAWASGGDGGEILTGSSAGRCLWGPGTWLWLWPRPPLCLSLTLLVWRRKSVNSTCSFQPEDVGLWVLCGVSPRPESSVFQKVRGRPCTGGVLGSGLE